MKPAWHTPWALGLALVFFTTTVAYAQKSDSFRAVLELSGVGPEVLARLSEGPDYRDEDWQTLLQVFSRLEQFHDIQPTSKPVTILPKSWRTGEESSIGELFELTGRIVLVEKVSLPDKLSGLHDWQGIYRCKFEFSTSGESQSTTNLLTTRIPKSWPTKQELSEPVKLRGVLVQLAKGENGWDPLLLTNYLAWYPTANVPTGQLLLARAGMDVGLLDEVRHRKPFVKPEISREGEAFYAALVALAKLSPGELEKLARENVTYVANSWRVQQPDLLRKHKELEAEFSETTNESEQEAIKRKVKQAKNQRGLAAAVLNKAESGQSSVAPMFLQPEKEVGELFVLEGIARRAVRIAVEQQPEMEAYYELELFTSDSQNLPIVCCVCRLPDSFPTGDEIREPVRISAVFFKSWRYRSRRLTEQAGETGRQRQLYTPVVLGKVPKWLNKTANRDNRWAFWGGVAFLGVLALLWISLSWLARRDRRARTTLRQTETINL